MRNRMTKVTLHFDMTVEVDPEFADELGSDIAHDILCEMFNGEDVFEIKYVGYDVQTLN